MKHILPTTKSSFLIYQVAATFCNVMCYKINRFKGMPYNPYTVIIFWYIFFRYHIKSYINIIFIVLWNCMIVVFWYLIKINKWFELIFSIISPGFLCVGNISKLDHEDRCAVRWPWLCVFIDNSILIAITFYNEIGKKLWLGTSHKKTWWSEYS